jgi:branched-chain amino acid transport system ATP-binding protein
MQRFVRRQALLRPGTWLLVAFAIVLPFIQSGPFYQQQFQLVAVYSLVAVGLNLNLYAGELVVGQSAIFGAGAYSAAVLLDRHPGTDGIVVILFSIVVATAVGLLIGIPGLRVGRWYLAMMSFFMVIVAQDLLGQLQDLTGGHAGIVGLPNLTVLGATVADPLTLYFVCVALLGLTLVLTRNMLTSSWGAALATLRRSDVAAQSVGMSRYRTKLMVYGLSAVPCGLAGALFVYSQQVVLPDIFSINLSVLFLAAAVLGGERTLLGPVIGMGLLQAVPIYSVSLQAWAPVMYGAFLIIVTVAVPGGIIGTLRRFWLRIGAVRDAEAAEVLRDIPLGAADSAAAAITPRRLTLTVRGVDKSFRGLRALQDVALVAEPGNITALIGANGSGKTTLLNIVSGFYRADAGSITLGDTAILGLGPHRIARAGVGRTFQTPILPEATTVLNAVVAALHWRRRATLVEHMLTLPRSRRERREWKLRAYALLQRVGLADAAHQRASALSLGHRRMLELARALALEPSVMLLDEPASGLSETEVAHFRTVVHGLRESGIAVVLVEHNLKLVLDLADVLFVLDHGRLIASGTAQEVRAHPEAVRSYLGEQSSTRVAPRQRGGAVAAPGDVDADVHVRNVDVELGSVPILHGATLDVEAGRLGVVLGPNGAGKTTLLRALSGLCHPRSGSIVVLGEDVSRWAPNRIARLGVQHVQEGKRVFRRLSVEDNLRLGGYRRKADPAVLQRVLELFPVLHEKRHLAAGSLSGGEQQMLAIAQSLMGDPRVLLLDEPSAGLAPLLVRRMFDVLERLRGTGLTILLVEQIVAESLALADSGAVLVSGRVVLTGDGGELRERPDLDALYFGAEPAAATAAAAGPPAQDK